MTIVVGWIPRPEADAAVGRGIEEGTLRNERAVVKASLFVIGLRHRSNVGAFLRGSGVQEILMAVRCPDLAVPATT